MNKQAPVSQYLQNISGELATGHAQEHSYRPALKTLFEDTTGLKIVNEPKGSAHGRPDFIFLKGDVPIAWVEAKDLHVSLEKIETSEQMGRYYGYPNLILTNGLEFRFFKNGARYGDAVVIAAKKGQQILIHEEHFDQLARTIADFIADPTDTIRSAQHLAKIMGGKARRIRDNVRAMLAPDYDRPKGDIEQVMQALKTQLIHDMMPEQFADLYAQTLVYGLFAARYNDDTPDTFSRTEARDRVPAGNPLLQQFFDHIAGANFVPKLSYIVDELCDVFLHANVHDLVHGLYRKESDTHDPIIHFYEDFLKEYDPQLRAQRGVFYTPLPVVRYIVRSVDALLKQYFELPKGLEDTSMVERKFTVQGKKAVEQVHRVQLLDPAVGTGTFLDQVIRHVRSKFDGQEGRWPAFAQQHLVPRLNGFELMMASYTIAHLKLSMTLAETGVEKLTKRLRVFLTNSLEEPRDTDANLFTIGLQGALTEEAQAASDVKHSYPIMVVLGNPPYSVSSQNASVETGPEGRKRKTWIGALLDDYKKDLNEKSYNSLSDDYVKFIRFAHYLVEKNQQGIVAMITNNSFLDGITHRRMRESLLQTFDHIYVLDLHGSSKRKETAPDGGKDENVFDIQQGVSISLLVKTSAKKKALGKVHHLDLYGRGESKYAWLDGHDISSTPWQELETPEPNFFFVPKDFGLQEEYDKGIKLDILFVTKAAGIKTHHDDIVISNSKDELEKKIVEYFSDSEKFDSRKIRRICYRPFDIQYIYYDTGIIVRHRQEQIKHSFFPNISLLLGRQSKSDQTNHFFITNLLSEMKTAESTTGSYHFPLYHYSNSDTLDNKSRTANLNMDLLNPVLKKLSLEWIGDGAGDGKTTCGPEDILDYIYAVLHSPTYRERYKEFLKIDFPRVPFTGVPSLFWNLVKLGRELRQLHLLEHPSLGKLATRYPVAGNDTVEKISYDPQSKRVFINAQQYFEGIEPDVWNFPIGGYQPLQKWLKDRKGRILNADDLLHWQKIVVALSETKRVMGEIDDIARFPMQT